MRSGVSASEARRLTRLEFGGIDQIKEDCRESRGGHCGSNRWCKT